MNYYYKTCDFIFRDNKEKYQRGIDNEYGYNFDTNNRRVINEDYSKKKMYINKEFINNNKLR